MITDDIEVAREIFALLDSGIVDGYDAFELTVVPHDEYMERELLVTLNGVQSSNARTDINGAMLGALVEQLKKNALIRGHDWKSFSMSYRKGGEVKTRFSY